MTSMIRSRSDALSGTVDLLVLQPECILRSNREKTTKKKLLSYTNLRIYGVSIVTNKYFMCGNEGCGSDMSINVMSEHVVGSV